MFQLASMDMQGILKSVLSGDDTISWIESHRMSDGELLYQLIEILNLADKLLNSKEKSTLFNLLERSDPEFARINNLVHSLANHGEITLSKRLCQSVLSDNWSCFEEFICAIGTLVCDEEKHYVEKETYEMTHISKNQFHYGFLNPKYIHSIKNHLRSILSDEMIKIYTSSWENNEQSLVWKTNCSKEIIKP